jgi:hypothetical protein
MLLESLPRNAKQSAIPLADAAEGYRAMDERRAIKSMLRV